MIFIVSALLKTPFFTVNNVLKIIHTEYGLEIDRVKPSVYFLKEALKLCFSSKVSVFCIWLSSVTSYTTQLDHPNENMKNV